MSRGVWRGKENRGVAEGYYVKCDWRAKNRRAEARRREKGLTVRTNHKYRMSAGSFPARPWDRLEEVMIFIPGVTERQAAFALGRAVSGVQRRKYELRKKGRVPTHAEIVAVAKRLWKDS